MVLLPGIERRASARAKKKEFNWIQPIDNKPDGMVNSSVSERLMVLSIFPQNGRQVGKNLALPDTCHSKNSNARPSSAEDVQSHRWTKQTPSEMPGRAVNAKWEGLIIATIYGRTLAVCGRMFTAVRAALTVYGRSRTAGHSGPYGTGQPRHLGSVSHHELTESASRVKKAKQRGRTRRGRGVTQAARAKGEQERVRRVGSRAVSSVANAVVSDAKPGMAPGAYVSAEAVA
ncbi:hypothetical protein C8R47DRAFT_1085158 [Mycena vitilis]|nr:hypothetical protein C8R47DRAFT_1085158 [Mycena vitilis]